MKAHKKRPARPVRARPTHEPGQPDGAAPPGPPDRECLGSFPSLAAFARDAVAPLLRPGGEWLLDCLDLDHVLRVLAGPDRLHLGDGRVYLERRPAPPPGTSRPRRPPP